MVIAFLQFRFTWNIKIWKITTKSTTLAKKHTCGVILFYIGYWNAHDIVDGKT